MTDSSTDIPALPIICGPTASGKTSLALQLAERKPIEIVSADSRQIIRHLDIGTAKPTLEDRAKVRFHLIDLIEPGERYSAFRFIDDALKAVTESRARDRLPVIVGGTGLYLKALTQGVVEIEQEDMEIRERLENECEQLGSEALYKRLQALDPLEAARTHPNNQVRIIRALEIYHLTGKPKSQLVAEGTYKKADYSFEFFCLDFDREVLYGRINRRVDQMLEEGWLEEVQNLKSLGMSDQLRVANVIGYTELLDHLEGRLTLDDAAVMIKQSTRRYAKRQMTWFRHQPGVTSFSDTDRLLEELCARYAK